jgi:hypothetical protein
MTLARVGIGRQHMKTGAEKISFPARKRALRGTFNKVHRIATNTYQSLLFRLNKLPVAASTILFC